MKVIYILLPVVVVVAFFGLNKNNQETDDHSLISFNRDIRPILNKNCTGCHGGVSKQSNVSFIYREEALGRGHSGRLTIVPGDPDASELIARIEATDANVRMPYKAPALDPNEIKLLRDWIKQGAQWQEHWAFIKPKLEPIPMVTNSSVVNNPIDNFIQSKLEHQGLSLAPRAEKTTLLRRASFDLTGLPPSTKEVDDFLADQSDNAFEKQIDRLLASPRFGERWAAMWMDLARYADSWGFTRDEERDTWHYKEWVINALNDNKSYKDFVIEQLAGDLIPNRDLDNIIATGFHRQTPANSEGGTDDEEYRMVAVMDRSATTWSVLNAMTINCVQCHSHPYDPIEHDEYYKSLSFFNTTHDADFRDYKPLYKIAKNETEKQQTFDMQEQLLGIQRHQAEQAFSLSEQTKQSANSWDKVNIESALGDEVLGLEIYSEELRQALAEIKAAGETTDYRKVELLRVAQERIKELASKNQNIRQYKVKDGELFDQGSHEARVIFTLTSTEFLGNQSIQNIRFSAPPQNPEKAKHTPEKGFYIDDIKIFVQRQNGQKQQVAVQTFMANATEVMDTQLNRLASLNSEFHGKISNDGLNTGIGAGWYAHSLFFPRWTVAVLKEPLALSSGDRLVFELSQMQRTTRGDGMPSRIHRIKIDTSSYIGWKQYANSEERLNQLTTYKNLSQKLSEIEGYMMPVIFEQEAWNKRKVALFERGNFLQKIGDNLAPNTPAIFPAMSQHPTRLGLANWFFEPDQPLTSRVAVNRFWHRLFGLGIVQTLEDFGSAGTLPSHPELLDWLAIEFQQNQNWDIKALLKLIVMSHTYQQDETVQPDLYQLDPDNELFARGPRQRLTAEMVRDQALVASGLMVHKIGGEPTMPPQPKGIWGHRGVKFKDWINATDESRYRRAIYTFVRRAFMYPSFLTFDMETREISHERRIPTNTPLQALVTLNDPVYHEASQALGQLMYAQSKQSNDKKAIQYGFKRVLSRAASNDELNQLAQGLEQINAQVQNEQNNHTAVWTAMASVLLNLDEALTR